MESSIFKTLNCNFLIPTSYSFYEIVSKKIGIDKDLCHYQFWEISDAKLFNEFEIS